VNTASPPHTWAALKLELDLWAESGNSATFWWRDDDACEETARLHCLDALSRATCIPVSVAVIPARLQKSLPRYLSTRDNFVVLQHGYSHIDYSTTKAKKIELGGNRPSDEIQAELSLGCHKLDEVLGEQFLPVLVPPWNRIEPRIYPALPSIGFCGLSTMQVRKSVYPVANLLQVNSHLDPVDWRRDRGFIGEANALGQLLDHLSLRRLVGEGESEPTGILTHHLIQTEDVWNFCRSLFETLNQHSAVQWLSAREIWYPAER
jgi:hypothetical protein